MKRQLAALGLASILTVPTWIAAAHPLEASAKKVSVSKKAKAVTASIKALNSKDAQYIKKTGTTKKAYDRLSKKEKKTIKNSKTLAKHVKAMKTLVSKVERLKKDVSALSANNYKTKIAHVSSSYKLLSKAAAATVPKSTVSKMTYYDSLNKTNKSMVKLVKSSASTGLVAVVDVLNVANNASILEFLTAYEKLSPNQKLLFGGSKEAVDYLLTIKPLVKTAANFDAKYEKLDPTASSYLKNSYELLNQYKAVAEISEKIAYKDQNVEKTVDKKVAQFTKNAVKISALENLLQDEIGLKTRFEDATNALPGITTQFENVEKAVTAYKAANLTTYNGKKLKGKAIDIADKKIIAEYKKYENIPTVVTTMNGMEDYATGLNLSTERKKMLEDAGFAPDEIASIARQGHIPLPKNINALDEAIKNYMKLAGEQRTIVDVKIPAKKDYINDAVAIKAGISLNKKYEDALKKNDLGEVLKQFEAYKKAAKNDERLLRYVADANDLAVAPTTYAEAKSKVAKFEALINGTKTMGDIHANLAAYKSIIKDKPSGLSMIDQTVLKSYNTMLGVLEIEKLMPKVLASSNYTKAKLIVIQDIIKLYKKLDAPSKVIVDNMYPGVSDFVLHEKEIKEAMAVNQKYSELKPSKKTYMKDAQTVYFMYIDANETVQQYILNTDKIIKLAEVIKSSKGIVDGFASRVYSVYQEVYSNTPIDERTVSEIKSVINTYELSIKPYPKNSSLLEPETLKNYKKLTPIVDVYNAIFMLKSPISTEIERDNILAAIKAYNKLDAFGKYVIKNESKLQVKLPILGDETQINEAKKIDAAYKALKVGEKNYEFKLYNVFKIYDQATTDIKKYVVNKKVLEESNIRYGDSVNAALAFELAVNAINRRSAIKDVHILKNKYTDLKIKKPVALQFIPAETMKKYNSYLELIFLQNVAQLVYDQRLINGIWVKYDAWFFSYSQTQDHRNDVINMRKALLLFKNFNEIQMSILNNTPSYTSYKGMMEDSKGENIPIYNADGSISSYKPEMGFSDVFLPDEVIYNPSQWLTYQQVQNVLDAMAIEDMFSKLKPNSQSYGRDAMAVVDLFNSKGIPVQMYTLIRQELAAVERIYKEPRALADAFEAAIKAYSPDSDKIAGMAGFKEKYKKLDAIALTMVDKKLLKNYSDYIAADAANTLFQTITTTKSMKNNSDILAFNAAYSKLTSDGKKIIAAENNATKQLLNTIIADNQVVKAANTVDKKYEAIDQKKDNFEAEVAKLYKEYDKLSDYTKMAYTVYDQAFKDFIAKYGLGGSFGNKSDNPKLTADEFTRLVEALHSSSPLTDVTAVYELYKFIAVPQMYANSTKKVVALNFVEKNILTKYMHYDNLARMNEKLQPIKLPKTKFTLQEKDAIVEAIALYKKLARDPRYIADNEITFGDLINPDSEKDLRYLFTAEADIKVAEAADAKFAKIKKGDKAFAKNMIDAMKSYELLTPFQLKFFTQTTSYNMYKKDYGIAPAIIGKVDTIPEAIRAIVNFEKLVGETENNHDDIIQSPPGSASPDYQGMIDAIIKMDEYYKFIDREFTIEGEKLKLIALVNAKNITSYKFFMAYYKVQDYLNNIK